MRRGWCGFGWIFRWRTCAVTSVGRSRRVAGREQYRDGPALVAMKVLEAAGMLPSFSAGYPSRGMHTPGLIIADSAGIALVPRL
jgi:hypothetical protein